ncbi:MAG TPA: autotransporter domain-containing protein [Candidatus Omnitrophota bacterium]|nr:autotransporter domain-containing protein [Candidatus Omnitrophota bacterium]
MKKFIAILSILAISLAVPVPVFGASANWVGTTDATWSDTTGNWSNAPGSVPGAADTATFNGTGNGNTTIDLAGTQTVLNILFDNDDPGGAAHGPIAAYTIGAGGAGADTLILANGGAITMNANVNQDQTFDANLTLGTEGSTQTFAVTNNSTTNSLTIDGDITGSDSGGASHLMTLAVTSAAGGVDIGGIIDDGASGQVALTKSGAGTLTLSGANTYTGATTISAGTLSLGTADVISNASAVTVAGGAFLDMNGVSETIGSLAGNGTVTSGSGTLSSVTLTAGGDNTSTVFSGVIENGSGGSADTVGLTKAGSGALTLSGVNTFTGVTTMTAGTLSVATIGNGGASGNLGQATNAAANLVFNGGTLQYTGTTASTDRNFTINTDKTATIDVTTNNLTMSGSAVATNGALTKTGAGTLTLSGTNLYTGTTTVSGGTLVLTGGAAIADSGAVSLNNTAGATLQLNANETIGSLAGGGASGGNVNLQSFTLTTGDTNNTTYAGIMSGTGGLTKSGTGTLVLTGTNTFSGVTTLSNGTVSVGTIGNGGEAGNLGQATNAAANLVFDGGTLSYTGSTASTDRNFTIVAGKTAVFNITTNNLTLSGASGATTGGLTKTGAGTLTLAGANLYTGATTVNAGTLNLNESLTTSSGLVFGGNGTVVLADSKNITPAVTNTSGSAAGTLTLSGTSTVTGQVGAAGNAALAAVNAGATGKTATFAGDVYATTTSVTGTGTVDLNGSLTGTTLNFAGDGTVNLADNKTITAAITTGTTNTGTLQAGDGSTINGQIGTTTNRLKAIEVDVALAAAATFQNDVYAVTTTVSGTGDVNLNGSLTGTTLNYGADNTVILASGKNITAAVTTATANTGTLELAGGTSTITGQVGTGGARLKAIEMDAALVAATFSADIYATTTTIDSTGTANFNGNVGSATASSNVVFAADGTVKLAAGKGIFGTVTNTSGGTAGTLTFLGSSATGGDLGATGVANHLKAVNLGDGVTDGGTVVLNHNIYATTTTINKGARLSMGGSHAVTGNLVVAANGGVALGANTLTVNGNYDASAASTTMNLTINSASVFGNIAATGTAALNTTSTLNLTIDNTYIPSGTTFTVIHGAGGAGGGGMNVPSTITTNSSHLTFSAAASSGDLILTANRAQPYANVATNGNAAAAGTALEVVGETTTNSDMLSVLATLDGLDSTQLEDALDTLYPDPNGAAMQGAREIANQFYGMVSNRQAGVRTGISTGDGFHGIGFWAQGLGSFAHQDANHGIEGYRVYTFGTTLGIDKLFGSHTRLGLAGGYGYGNVRSRTPGTPKTSINSWQAQIYGSYDSLLLDKEPEIERGVKGGFRDPWENSWYVDGMAAFTQNHYDGSRSIYLGSTSRTATNDSNAQEYSTRYELGYTFLFDITRNLQVTPFTSLQYSYLYQNAYKEKGAGALNLNVNGQGYNFLEQGLGMKLAYPFLLEDVSPNIGTLIPALKVAWLYDYIGDKFETTSSFQGGGPSFKTNGPKPARSGILFGGEIAFLSKGNMTLTANWDWEIKEKYSSQNYYGTIRFDF